MERLTAANGLFNTSPSEVCAQIKSKLGFSGATGLLCSIYPPQGTTPKPGGLLTQSGCRISSRELRRQHPVCLALYWWTKTDHAHWGQNAGNQRSGGGHLPCRGDSNPKKILYLTRSPLPPTPKKQTLLQEEACMHSQQFTILLNVQCPNKQIPHIDILYGSSMVHKPPAGLFF